MTKFIATTTNGEAPVIEDAMYDAIFTGLSIKEKVESKFGVADKFIWAFDIKDEDGAQLYDVESEKPIKLDMMTGQNMNVASETVPGAIKVLKVLLTPGEYAAFVEGTSPDSDALIGRAVQVVVVHNKNGWPQISSVLPKRKGFKVAE